MESQPFIAGDAVDRFPEGALVLLVSDGWRELARVRRGFRLREAVRALRGEIGMEDDEDMTDLSEPGNRFLQYLYDEGYLEVVDAMEMHIHSDAYPDGVTAYESVG
jgi:hypothetical protein